MPKIIKYKLLSDYSLDNLENDMNKFIQEGWQPYCQPFKIRLFGKDCIVQAIVKYKEEK